ncbi:MAG: outer membrane protein transport protein [Desulfobulbaceae bacterium]|nr:outer membrane protein transport protein [Desulfobulbaceae bacterium]
MTDENYHVAQQKRMKPAGIGFILLCLLVQGTGSATASGFRITNQSLGAVGQAGAHIAFTPGPDASYYNPANMGDLADAWQVETSLTFLALPTIEYQDSRSPLLDGSSDSELFVMPLVHAVSPQYGKLRFGFSLTYPYGLSKQWQQPFPRASAEQFSLLVVEGNPTFAYEPVSWLSIGGGVRVVYGKGEVDSAVSNPPFAQLAPLTELSRSSDGTDTQLGYNLALTLKPQPNWRIAATYRSEVELDLDGDGRLGAWLGTVPIAAYSGSAEIGVSLPAVLSLATSYTIDRLTVELGWDRTFWSSFKVLDFTYDQNFTGTVFDGFDRPVVKNWEDSDAFRIGLSYEWNQQWTTTLGLAYDQTPVPDATLGFELPDADALIYCAGVRYRASAATELGLSYMYHRTESRSVTNEGVAGLPGIDGTFTEGGAHAVTIGVITRF